MIDLIIVNFQSTPYLLHCLASIYATSGLRPSNIFIQDNGSTDGVERITSEFPDVILQRNYKNLGFAAGVNQALKKSTAPYVMLLNPDSEVHEGLFDTTTAFMEANPEVGVLGPKILDSDGSIQGSARSLPTLLAALFGRQSLFTRLFPNNRITRANLLTNLCDGINPLQVDWVSGACMVVRRSTIDAVGVLDERFFMYWEDADWCRRINEAGWQVVYYPCASVVHFVGKSSSTLVVRSVYEFHKSVYLLFSKYFKSNYILLEPLILVGLFVRFSFLLASGKLEEIFSNQQRRRAERLVPLPLRTPSKPPIKVLRLIARLNIGGPAIHVHLLTSGLDRRRFNSILVTGSTSPQEGDMSYLFDPAEGQPKLVPELQRDISFRMDLQAFFRIFQLLDRQKPDIVHTHTAKAGFSARIAVVIYNLIFGRHVKIVHTFHGHVFEGYFNRFNSKLFVLIERMIAKFTDTIVAISSSQKYELAHKYHIAPSEKIETIELGFDLAPFLKCKRLRGGLKAELGIAEDTSLIGIIGRLIPIKNLFMFFDAVRILMDRYPRLNAKFVVVGDGELRAELESYCRRNRLEQMVFFQGWVKNVPRVYADLDILALTSNNEGTPVSIIEAMAASVPVIATHAGGVEDLLGASTRHAQTSAFTICERGIRCEKNDAAGFADGIQYLLRSDSLGKQARVRRARDYITQRYSRERLIGDVERLYSHLIDQRDPLPALADESTAAPPKAVATAP